MSDIPKAEENEPQAIMTTDARFFIDELARMDVDIEKRYRSLSERVGDLEKKLHSDTPELFDGRMIGIMILLTITPVLLEIVGSLVVKWRSSES